MATRSAAPGELEDLRALVNSWHIPNKSRRAIDELDSWASSDEIWSTHFMVLPRPGSLIALRGFRDGLREMLAGGGSAAVDVVVQRYIPVVGVSNGVLVVTPSDGRAVSVAVAVLLRAAAASGTLTRLRTCPDCEWAFYDNSRSGRRVWCAMVGADSDGRGCGSAAKMRAYRARQRRTAAALPTGVDEVGAASAAAAS